MRLVKILGKTSLLSSVLTIKMSSNIAYSNEMKTKLIELIVKEALKARKDKQSGSLQYLQANELSKDVGVPYCISY